MAGIALALPFLAFNALVAAQIAPVAQFFDGVLSADVVRLNPLGLVVFVSAILMLAVGAALTLWQAGGRSSDGRLVLHPANLAVGALLLGLVVLLVFGLGEEIYRCEVLGLTHCD